MSKAGKHVFIIHHFDAEGRKRANLLAEILQLLTIEVMFGENLGGQRISDGVRKRIESARLVVAVLTRDIKVGEDTWQPSQWILQEVIWAVAHHVPCLLVVEEGVKFDGGIAGDLEQIRFAPGDFALSLARIVGQVQTMMSLDVDIPTILPHPNMSDRVRVLIMEARECAKKRRWDEVLRLSEEALRHDPTAAVAALNKGVAFVHLGQLTGAENFFLRMLQDFAGSEDSLLAKVYNNLAWVEQVKDAGSLNVKSLRKQARYLEKGLALDHNNVHSRASLILCRVALEELNEALALLMDSLKKLGFPKALRRETVAQGAVGHRLLSKLPDWLYSILFPTSHTNDDDKDNDEGEN